MINELKSHFIHFSILLFIIILLLQFNLFLINIQSYENADINEREIEGIIVLTGDKFRISEGLKILNSEIGYKLLISGVNKEISIEEIKKEFPKYEQLFNCCIELENISTNTFENIREIFFWKKNNNIKNILLITSDYHLPRVKLEVNRLLLEKETYYYGVKYENQKINIRMKKLIVEYIKYLRTRISLGIGLY